MSVKWLNATNCSTEVMLSLNYLAALSYERSCGTKILFHVT